MIRSFLNQYPLQQVLVLACVNQIRLRIAGVQKQPSGGDTAQTNSGATRGCFANSQLVHMVVAPVYTDRGTFLSPRMTRSA